MDWLTSGMRIDEARLSLLRRKDFRALRSVYKRKAAKLFLDGLEHSVLSLKVGDCSRSRND